MEVSKTLKPGDRGTPRLLGQYGERLVCVRYPFDPRRNKNPGTVELIVDEHDTPGRYLAVRSPRPVPRQNVLVQVGFHATELRARVKQANGR